jgi:peptide/nickel transport system substrate-binding protein
MSTSRTHSHRSSWARWLLPALLWVAIAGCSEPSEAPPLRFGLKASPLTLDPRFATDAASTRIDRLLYRSLVDFDDAFEAVPSLAAWQRLTPTRYRFTLGEEGRLFHDGSRLVARDVKATYDSVLDPRNGSPHRSSLANIRSISVIDDDSLEFELERPDPLFPALLVIGVLPGALIEAGHPFAREPIGSGPFAFAGWPEEGRLELVRAGGGDRLEFVAVADPTVRVLKLLHGEVDLLQNDLLPELVEWLAERPGVTVARAQGTSFAYLGFNLRDPALSDLRVRRAIAYAIDREAIIRYVMGGAARLASAILPPEHWAGAPALAPIEHDPAMARALLREAGYSARHRLRIVYKTSTDPLRVRIATIIADQLAGVGIDVELATYDWGTFYGDIKEGRFQMYSLAWVGIKTPDIYRYTMHSQSIPDAGANRGRFRSALADELIEQAGAAESLEEQARLYRRLQAHLLEQLPYVPLWYEDHYVAARAGVRGYVLAADGNYDSLVATALGGGP